VDDVPYTGDLDLGSVRTRADLAALLRMVHIRADRPSLRSLEARTRHSITPLSKTVAAEMLKGVRFPRKAVMVAFLHACGVEDEAMDSWRRAWERVAAGQEAQALPQVIQAGLGPQHVALTEQHPSQVTGDDGGQAKQAERDPPTAEQAVSADPAGIRQLRNQIRRLNIDNDRLRAQLATTPRQTAEQLRPVGAVGGHRPHSPVVSRRELGALLHALRDQRGKTVEQVAEYLLCSPDKVRRMESSFRAGTVRDVRDLCDLYGVTETPSETI
jgi:hypothetical protein